MLNYFDSVDADNTTDYQKKGSDLYNELFTKRNYNRYMFPVFGMVNSTDDKIPRVNVHFDLWYTKLISLNAESQLLCVNLEFKMYWQDPRLSWNVSKFGGINNIFVSSDLIWVPDSQIGNAKTIDSVKAGESMRAVEIFSNGTVYFPVFYYTEVACPIIINTFPFDKQLCPIPLMSLALDVKYLTMSASINPFLFRYSHMKYSKDPEESGDGSINIPTEIDESIAEMFTKSFFAWGNGEWDVTNISVLSTVQEEMQVIAYVLYIRRVPNFYIYVIATPCFIMTTLAIVGMFWTPNIKKEQLVKLTIGLTSLVSMTVLLDMLSSAIPKTSTFPLLGIYVVFCVAITSCASIVITLHSLPNPIKHHGPQDEKLLRKDHLNGSSTIFHTIANTLHRNVLFLVFFQVLNLIGFIVFLSFWN